MNEVEQIRDIEKDIQVLKTRLRFIKSLFALRVLSSKEDAKKTEEVSDMYNDGFISESEYIEKLAVISGCSSDQYAEVLFIALQYKEIEKA